MVYSEARRLPVDGFRSDHSQIWSQALALYHIDVFPFSSSF